MQLLVALTLIGLLVLCVTALFQLKETMLDDRKEKVHNIVEVGLGIIAHHHKLAADGKLSEAEANSCCQTERRQPQHEQQLESWDRSLVQAQCGSAQGRQRAQRHQIGQPEMQRWG